MKNTISKHTLDILEWNSIEKELSRLCRSETGKTYALNLRPLNVDQAKKQLKIISDFKNIITMGNATDFSGISDIASLITLTEKSGILKLEELILFKRFVEASKKIKKFLKIQKEEYPTLEEQYNSIEEIKELTTNLIESITDNEELNEKKYKQLKKIKDEIHSTKQEAKKILNSMLSSPSIDSFLQEKIITTRNERYVLLVKANMKGKIKGNVYDISASGSTLYIEPEKISNLNNKAIILENNLLVEINKILKSLSLEISKYSDELKNNLTVLTYLDFINASANYSIKIKGNEPEISKEPVIELYNARHPILYSMDPGGTVGNDFSLGKDYQCLIISGANTGGKTVLLKTIGICSLMAIFGLHIPASEDSTIGIFTNIMADIGDDQNLSQSLSTFSGQIKIINDMLSNADSNTLVMIDEIIVGTNPGQGAALAQSIMEEMVNTGCKAIVTTHYSELKDLPTSDKRFNNGSVSFDLETLKPTYKLRIGIPGVSYAIEIAKNYNLSANILNRAKELLDKKELSMEALIEKIQKYEQELEEEKDRISFEKNKIEDTKIKLDEKEKKIQKQLQQLKLKEGLDLIDELNRYKEKVAARIHNLQTANLKNAGDIQKDLIEIQKELTDELDSEKSIIFSDKYKEFNPKSAVIGNRVFVTALETEGILESINEEKKYAVILLGTSIKSRFSFKDLMQSHQPQVKKKKNAQSKAKKNYSNIKSDNKIPLTIQTSYNTIDVRGKRVDEAISIITNQLDKMSRSGIDTIIIIHGHGTGALKEAIRENLKHSHQISKFRSGEHGEGGDGVTLVQF